jgi:Zn-dependent peptidase ImmA (M78 family)
MKDSQPFAKLKEVQADTQANAFAANLILPNRTQAHPPPKQRTMDNLMATFDNNPIVNCNFDGFKLEI